MDIPDGYFTWKWISRKDVSHEYRSRKSQMDIPQIDILDECPKRISKMDIHTSFKQPTRIRISQMMDHTSQWDTHLGYSSPRGGLQDKCKMGDLEQR